jgi:hypothetical protein
MQTISIDCSDTTGQHCGIYVGMDIDTDVIKTGSLDIVMTAWNSLKAN